jgi:glutathione S-transferase
MGIDFYYLPASAPCRSILMLGRELNIEFNLKTLNLQAGEHLKPEFVALNPQHTIPTIVDDGFVLWESRAILQYLASKQDSELYPKELQARATVNRLLYFDLGTLYKGISDYFYSQIFAKQAPDEEKHKSFKQALTFLDVFIGDNDYVAGSRLTIADLAILASLTFPLYVFDYDYGEWKNISRWLSKLQTELSYYSELNEEPNKAFKAQVSGN